MSVKISCKPELEFNKIKLELIMCGIGGIIGKRSSRSAKKIIEKLLHRGPDSKNFWISDEGGFPWLAAFIWAVWPSDKSLIDPIAGNVTGKGSRNSGDTFG